MQISGIQGGNAGTGQVRAAQTTDSVSKGIQNQIANLQKQMQELSSNKEMSTEEKMKKRQEFQQQIFELQNQLRQHEIELRREAQQESGASMEEMLGGGRQEKAEEEDGVNTSFSDAGMQAMILADSAVGQAKTQGSVAKSLKGRAGILKTEIELDGARGAGTEMKQSELAAITQRAMQASASQIKSLGGAVKVMKEAAKEETEQASANQTSQVEEVNEGSSSQTGNLPQNAVETVAGQDSEQSMAEKYNPVNILL